MDRIIRALSLTKQHVKFLIAIAIIILASSTFVSYLNSRDLVRSEQKIAESYRTMQNMERLLSTMIDAETGRRGYFITEDESFLDSYKDASSTVDTLYSKIKAATKENPSQQLMLDTLTTLIKQRFYLFEQGIKLQEVKGNNIKLHRPLLEMGNELQSKMKRNIENMKTEERRVLMKNQEIAVDSANLSKYGMLGGASFSILLMIFAYGLLIRITSVRHEDHKPGVMSRDELESLVRDRTAEISQLSLMLNRKTTDLDKLKNALAVYEQSYRSLFEQSHDSIIVFTPDEERVLDINQKACESYGIRRTEFIGISLKFLSKNVPQGEEEIKKVLSKGFHSFQTVHYKKDGSEMLLQVSASLMNYKGQKAILAINREITDRVFQVI